MSPRVLSSSVAPGTSGRTWCPDSWAAGTRPSVSLDVNGSRAQTGDLNQMIWKVPEIIAELSKLVTLAAGDVIMTGTPSGVGPVRRGDKIECGIDGIAHLSLSVV